MTMADEIAVMNDGRVEQRGGADELYERPRTAFVAQLPRHLEPDRRQAAPAPATFVTDEGDAAARSERRRPTAPSRAGVRPEKIRIVRRRRARRRDNVLRGR